MLKSKTGQQNTQTKLNIQFKQRRQVKKPLCKGENVFIFFTPKQIVLEPHQEILVDMLIQIQFPKQLILEFVILPSLTKMEIKADILNEQTLQIKLFNKSFSDTLRIKKNTGIVAMYFLNNKDIVFKIKDSYTN